MQKKVKITCYSIILSAAAWFSILPATSDAQTPLAYAPSGPYLENAPIPMSSKVDADSEKFLLQRVYQSGWAGYVLFAPNDRPLVIPQNRFWTAQGQWVVPNAIPTINCNNSNIVTDGDSVWIGLDGWTATFTYPNGDQGAEVLQAGTETDVHCDDRINHHADAYFWIEWAGTKNIPVTKQRMNLPVNIGDNVSVRIAADTEGPDAWQAATVYFDDLTTGKSYQTHFHSGCTVCSGDHKQYATLFGATVEWVAEITFNDANNSKWVNTLNDFGSVQMEKISATDNEGNVYTPANPRGSLQQITWMSVNGSAPSAGDTLLACASIAGPEDILIERAPFQVVSPERIGDLEPKPLDCAGAAQPPLPPKSE